MKLVYDILVFDDASESLVSEFTISDAFVSEYKEILRDNELCGCFTLTPDQLDSICKLNNLEISYEKNYSYCFEESQAE